MMKIAFGKRNVEKEAREAAVCAIACWLVLGILLESLALGAVAALACIGICLALLLYYPKARARNYAAIVEAEMPFLLMGIALELNLGVPFHMAIEHASEGKGRCAKEFWLVAGEVKEQGASMQDALRHFSERIESRLVKRAIVQLAAAFEQGNRKSGEPVKRIAMEILTRQRVESKLFSGKLVVFSLLFIAVSAVVPALFQSFSLVGSAILHMSFTATQLFLIIAVGFPLIDIGVLLYIRAKTPVFLRGRN
jgi:hypothetical protein